MKINWLPRHDFREGYNEGWKQQGQGRLKRFLILLFLARKAKI